MKYSYQKINGIILNSSNIGEYNKIITLLDKELGKLTFYSFGSSKENSKKRSNLITSNIISGILFYHYTKDYYTLKEVTTIKCFENITKNLKRSSYLFFLFEILINILPEKHNINYYNIIIETLNFLDTEDKYEKYILFTIFNIFRYEGIFPNLTTNDIKYYIKNIKSNLPNNDFSIYNGSFEFLEFMFIYNNINYLKSINLSESIINNLINFISIIYKYYYKKDIKSISLFLI